ncbi:MAG: stress response translation initiation inhibitor YciH [Acidobacteriota bacterium]
MADDRRARTVYSTANGPVCPVCGWPKSACRCSTRLEQAVPEKIVAKLRVEKAGRGGKTVTVVDGLPRNASFLKTLAADLKRLCGTGGAAGESSVELQGDQREKLRAHLSSRGWTIKG